MWRPSRRFLVAAIYKRKSALRFFFLFFSNDTGQLSIVVRLEWRNLAGCHLPKNPPRPPPPLATSEPTCLTFSLNFLGLCSRRFPPWHNVACFFFFPFMKRVRLWGDFQHLDCLRALGQETVFFLFLCCFFLLLLDGGGGGGGGGGCFFFFFLPPFLCSRKWL